MPALPSPTHVCSYQVGVRNWYFLVSWTGESRQNGVFRLFLSVPIQGGINLGEIPYRRTIICSYEVGLI